MGISDIFRWNEQNKSPEYMDAIHGSGGKKADKRREKVTKKTSAKKAAIPKGKKRKGTK